MWLSAGQTATMADQATLLINAWRQHQQSNPCRVDRRQHHLFFLRLLRLRSRYRRCRRFRLRLRPFDLRAQWPQLGFDLSLPGGDGDLVVRHAIVVKAGLRIGDGDTAGRSLCCQTTRSRTTSRRGCTSMRPLEAGLRRWLGWLGRGKPSTIAIGVIAHARPTAV